MNFRIFKTLGIAVGLVILSASSQPSLHAEISDEERHLFDFGQKAMNDGLDELASTKFQQLLNDFPETEYRDEASWLLSRARLNQGRWQEAIDVLEPNLTRVAEKWKDSYLFVIAEAQLKGELYAAAYSTYGRIISEFPKSKYFPDARYGSARALVQQQRFDEAQTVLQDLQNHGKKELNTKATLTLGISYYLQKNFDEASRVLSKVVKDEGKNPVGYQAMYALGVMELSRNKLEAARSRFETLAKMESPDAQSMVPSALYSLGQIEIKSGNATAAIADFETAFRKTDDVSLRSKCVDELLDVYLSPKINEPETLARKLSAWADDYAKTQFGESLMLQIANLWQRSGKKDVALQALKNYFENYPNGRYADQGHYQMGWVYLDQKNYEKASAEFLKSIEITKNGQMKMDALMKLGDLAFERQQYNIAATHYAKASEIKVTDSKKAEAALYQAANAYLRGGLFPEVLRCYENYNVQYPSGKLGPDFLFLVAEGYRKVGDMTKVLETYKSLLARFPQSNEVPRASVEYADALFIANKFKEAVEAVSGFVAKFPKSDLIPPALMIQARSYERLDQLDKSVEACDEIIKSYPKSSTATEAQFWLGTHYYRSKNYAKAQQEFELLVKNNPNHQLAPEAMYFAARAAYRLGQNKQDTARLTDRLVKDYPDSPWVFDARFLYADLLSEKGKFDEALLLFEDLTKNADLGKTNVVDERVLEALGRRAECLRQLKRYNDSLELFKRIRDYPKADASVRNQASVEMGKTYENMGELGQSIENYLFPLYTRQSQNALPENREFFWICKGGFEAVRILELEKKWKDAVGVLKRMKESNLPCKKEIDEMMNKIKTEHAISN